MACDAAGRALAFRLAPGQGAELKAAVPLLAVLVGLGAVGRVEHL